MFLAVGPCIASCLEAAERLHTDHGLSIGVVDARWVKPLDEQLLDTIVDRPLITVEENTLEGGFGSAVMEYFADQGKLQQLRIHRMGIPGIFSEQATRNEQLAAHDLHTDGLYAQALAFVQQLAHETV
jgi:1-deoxy-D-xylulose-5-phosphate synthase